MNDTARERFAGVYGATTYRVDLPAGPCDLRVGWASPQLDGWLASLGQTDWAYVTAMNPQSRRLPVADNLRRQEAFAQRVAAVYPTVRGIAIADAGDWPDEAGILIAGIDEPTAMRLAADVGQHALLAGSRGQPARLVWLDAAAPIDATRSGTRDAAADPPGRLREP